MQNCATAGFSVSQLAHVRDSGAPHARQNLAISGFSVAQAAQTGIARVYGPALASQGAFLPGACERVVHEQLEVLDQMLAVEQQATLRDGTRAQTAVH